MAQRAARKPALLIFHRRSQFCRLFDESRICSCVVSLDFCWPVSMATKKTLVRAFSGGPYNSFVIKPSASIPQVFSLICSAENRSLPGRAFSSRAARTQSSCTNNIQGTARKRFWNTIASCSHVTRAPVKDIKQYLCCALPDNLRQSNLSLKTRSSGHLNDLHVNFGF